MRALQTEPPALPSSSAPAAGCRVPMQCYSLGLQVDEQYLRQGLKYTNMTDFGLFGARVVDVASRLLAEKGVAYCLPCINMCRLWEGR